MSEVDSQIRDFERRFGTATADFLKNTARRQAMSEDDILRWEALVDIREELKMENSRIHGQYLQNLFQPRGRDPKASAVEDKLAA
ncbi:MAG: hypothetical protein WCF68_18355 [Terriglobales bacterium]